MELFKGLKKRLGVAKSAINSATGFTTYKELADYFTWRSKNKGIKAYLKSFTNNPLVYMVVSKISKTTASMPRTVEDAKGNEINESKLKTLIENPNKNQSQIEFNEEANESLLLAGNTYILFETNPEFDLVQDTLTVLKPDRTTPQFDKFGVLYEWEYVDEFGRTKHYLPENVLHIKTSNVVKDDSYHYTTGLSPLEAGWIVIQASDEKFEAEASIFKNKGIAGFISTDSDTPMLPKERQRMQEALDSDIGGAKHFNKLQISTTRLKYLQTGMSPTDLKLIDGIVSSLRLVCGLFGMPSVLFNDTANSSFNNYSTAVEVSYSDVYVPLANKIDEKLSSFLSGKYGVDETIKVDSSKIDAIKQSTNEVAQTLTDLPPLLASAIVADMTQNERREIVNLKPKEGGDIITPIASNPVNVNI